PVRVAVPCNRLSPRPDRGVSGRAPSHPDGHRQRGLPVANEEAWGRVGDDGTVYVREGDGERAVGSYPDATPEEALAYFERKFTELQGQVALLEQRVRGGAPAADVSKAIASLSAAVEGANAVGDLASLTERLEKLSGSVGELTEKQSAEARALVDAALADREVLVAEVEALAAHD